MMTTKNLRSYLAHFFLESEMFQTNVQKIKTRILYAVTFFISKILPLMGYSRTGHRQHGACALHAGYLRQQTHTHSEYAILIAVLLQKRASLLGYTYIICLVTLCCVFLN